MRWAARPGRPGTSRRTTCRAAHRDRCTARADEAAARCGRGRRPLDGPGAGTGWQPPGPARRIRRRAVGRGVTAQFAGPDRFAYEGDQQGFPLPQLGAQAVLHRARPVVEFGLCGDEETAAGEHPVGVEVRRCGAGVGGMLVRADDSGVDRDVPVDLTRRIGLGLDQLEQSFPGSVSRPQPVSFVDGLPRAEPFGQVTPLHAGPYPVQNPVDHLPVIPPPAATTITEWQKRPEPDGGQSHSASVRSPRPVTA